MNKLNFENVLNNESLLKSLGEVSVEVPGRSEGRRTEHTERWSLCYLLATLSSIDALDFPLSLEHVDKPDFILKTDESLIGIEVTESIPSDYAKCCALAETEKPDAVIDMSLFKWNSPSKTTNELRQIINSSELMGDGWSGQSVEDEWAHFINDAISIKLNKLNNTGYADLPEYWLSIYDNLPLPNLNAQKATEILISKSAIQWEGKRLFTTIFIERGPIIIEIKGHKAINHEINDIWN